MTALAAGRDVALLLLILEAFVIALVPLAVLYLLVKHVPPFTVRLRGWLRTLVTRAMRALLAPVLWIAGLVAGVSRGLQVWQDSRPRDSRY